MVKRNSVLLFMEWIYIQMAIYTEQWRNVGFEVIAAVNLKINFLLDVRP